MVTSLIWPVLVACFLVVFRNEVRALLNEFASMLQRVKRLKFAGFEAETQLPAVTAESPGDEAKKKVDEEQMLDDDGFFNREGVKCLVQSASQIHPGEVATDALLLFRTRVQRTWIVATNKRLFCVLDDSETRASSRLIQWSLPLDKAGSIRVRSHKPRTGLLDIGPRTHWLYSRSLHPDGDQLIETIRAMIKRKSSPDASS